MKNATLSQKIALTLMLLSIMVIGFQIGATAKNGSNEHFYLLPVGISLLLVGLFIWLREMRKPKS